MKRNNLMVLSFLLLVSTGCNAKITSSIANNINSNVSSSSSYSSVSSSSTSISSSSSSIVSSKTSTITSSISNNSEEKDLIITEKEQKGGIFKSKKIILEVVKVSDVVTFIKDSLVKITAAMGVEVKTEVKERNDILNIVLII